MNKLEDLRKAGFSEEEVSTWARGKIAEMTKAGFSNSEAIQWLGEDPSNPPPPGVIIHEAGRSYVAGPPGSPYVDTGRMVEPPPAGATGPTSDNEARSMAAAALATRRDSPGLQAMRPLAPFLQGGTMSWGDELVSVLQAGTAALRGRPAGETYNLAQEAQRQELQQERAEHPYRSTALQVGGALTTLPYQAGLMRLGAGAAPLTRSLYGAGFGAGQGAVEGFGAGSGLGGRLQEAGIGLGIGGALGAAVPLVGQGIGSAYRNTADYFGINRNLQNTLGIGRPTADIANRALALDDALRAGGAGEQRIIDAGPNAMLADAGPATRAQLDTAVQRGGGGLRTALDAVNQRGAQSNLTLQGALDQALGPPVGQRTAINQINAASRDARRDLYEQSYDGIIDYASPAGQRLLDLVNRVPGSMAREANELLRGAGHRSRQISMTFDENDNLIIERLPDMRQLDYLTRGINSMAYAPNVAPEKAGIYRQLASEMREIMGRMVPAYGQALDAGADTITQRNAREYGYNMLNPSVQRDDVMQELPRFVGRGAQNEVRAGLRQRIDDLQAKVPGITSDSSAEVQEGREAIKALQALGSRDSREKLAMIMDPLQLEQLNRAIREASLGAELVSGMAQNSKTAGRQMTLESMRQANAPGVAGELLSIQPWQAVKRFGQFFTGRRPQDVLAREDQMYQELSELLTGPNALARRQALQNAYQQSPVNAARGATAGADGGPGLGLLGYYGLQNYLGRGNGGSDARRRRGRPPVFGGANR